MTGSVESVTLWILGAVLFPLWLVAGVCDWFCHRETKIEKTSGLTESVTHLVLASLAGSGVLLLLFLEINGFVLAALVVLYVAHAAATQIDLRWTDGKRDITPFEQQVHAYLEAIPFAGVVAVAILVFSTGRTEIGVALKAEPTPWRIALSMLTAMTLFGAIPFWEEFARCWRGSISATKESL